MEGDISAWNPDVSATDAILVTHTDNAVYKGLALLRENNNNDNNNDPLVHGNRWEPRLLAANFRAGRVGVFDGRFSLLPPVWFAAGVEDEKYGLLGVLRAAS